MFGKETKPVQAPDPIASLESRVQELEHRVRAIDTEWTEMYDKFRRLHMRLAKRDQREQPDPEPNGQPPISPMAARLLGIGG